MTEIIDAYMEMPLECMRCPRVLMLLAGAEEYHDSAEKSGQATLDDPALDDPQLLTDTLDHRMSLILDAQEHLSTTQQIIHTYAQHARIRKCPGVDEPKAECGVVVRNQTAPGA